MSYSVLTGSCVDLMPKMDKGSIDLVVTSPPYDNLRTYDDMPEWGEHIWKPCISEIKRVLKPGGVCVWIVGDATIKGNETGTSFRQALYAKESGLNLFDTMIYQKHGPINVRGNCYYPVFEYMFIFSNGEPKTFNPITDRPNRNPGHDVGKGSGRRVDGSKRQPLKHNKAIKSHGIRFNVWNVSPGASSRLSTGSHPATMPLQLAIDHVISWSNPGDVVFDPFTGSGTTGVAAISKGREFIGIELSPKYADVALERIGEQADHMYENPPLPMMGGYV